MSEDRRTIKNWAARLSAEDEPLTLAEAQLLATISSADRLYEMKLALGDIQARLTRLELFVAATAPGYDAGTRKLVRALVEAEQSKGASGHANV